MQKIAFLVAFGAAFGLLSDRAQAQCANGTCARPAIASYRPVPTAYYARGYRAPAPTYAAPAAQPAPAYGYQARPVAPPAHAAPRPAYQTAQARPYTYQRYYAPAASCPNGTCSYVR
jgi:hypothetical protein